MKLVETFKTREAASEKRRLLAERGVEARIVVDPLEARFPALCTFHGVALIVSDDGQDEGRSEESLNKQAS